MSETGVDVFDRSGEAQRNQRKPRSSAMSSNAVLRLFQSSAFG
jgi:hypothetical protein